MKTAADQAGVASPREWIQGDELLMEAGARYKQFILSSIFERTSENLRSSRKSETIQILKTVLAACNAYLRGL